MSQEQKMPPRRRKRPVQAEDLREEIVMLRDGMREVWEQATQGALSDDWLRALEAIGRGATRLAGLMKAQRQMGGEASVAEELSRALAEASREQEPAPRGEKQAGA